MRALIDLAPRVRWLVVVTVLASVAAVIVKQRPTKADENVRVLQDLVTAWATPPPPASTPPVGPTRNMACIDMGHLDLAVIDRDPVVCSETSCRRVDGDTNPLVARPRATEPLPLNRVPERNALPPHIRAAIARETDVEVTATLDGRAVVVGNQAFAVAADRPIALPPPLRPDHHDRELAIAGDVILYRSLGACTDRQCLTSQLVDRRGKQIDFVEADGAVLRVGDRYLVLVSSFSDLDVRDLHTGARRVVQPSFSNEGNFAGIVAIDDHTFARMRQTGDGVTIDTIELADSDMLVRFDAFLPYCY